MSCIKSCFQVHHARMTKKENFPTLISGSRNGKQTNTNTFHLIDAKWYEEEKFCFVMFVCVTWEACERFDDDKPWNVFQHTFDAIVDK